MEHWTLALSILAGALVVYYYLSRKRPNVFQQHGIPYGWDISLLRRIIQIFVFPKSFAVAVQEIYNMHRDAKYVGIFDFTRSIVVIRDLELLKSIGIKNFESFQDHLFFGADSRDPFFSKNLMALRGDRWRDVRSLLSPAFTSTKMKAMYHLMSECAVNFAEYLRSTTPPEGRTMEMREAITRYANDVISTCAFGVSVDSMRQPENDFYMYGKKITEFKTLALVKILLAQHWPVLSRFFNLKLVDEHSCEFFLNLVADTIHTRDEKGIIRPDMLQLMMDDRNKRESGRELTILDMTSQAFIFFMAGFESTSTVMSFATYELAINPDVQEKLQNEIDEALQKSNGVMPPYETINGMAYLNAVISETLRMYPAQPMTERLCTKDHELPATLPDAKPYLVRKGDMVWIPIYALHYNPEYFPEPIRFKPERFLDENRDQCNLNAYYPFGLGPRMCIGNRFAILEMKVMLFHVLARCDLKPCEKTPIPMKLKNFGFSMRAEAGCWMNVAPRRNQRSMIASAT